MFKSTKVRSHVKMILATAALSGAMSPVWADQLADVKASGKMVCGVLGAFEPFGFTDISTRTLEGYDVDFCKAIAKHLGVQAEVKAVSVEARIPELQQGRMDLLAAGLGYSAKRAEQVDYTYGYYISDHKLTVKKARNFKTATDLSGKRVSFTKGGITEGFVKKSVPGAELVGYEDTPTAFTALVQNKVAAFSVPEVVAHRLINKLGPQSSQYELLEPAVGQEVWGLGVRKGETAMLDAVNGALKDMEASGEAQQIFDKWLGKDSAFNMKRAFTIKPITE
ncbi:transporter substrate-binding domain-containing protein [Pokkaliibacter sp. CJK22405]|uniref:transporter substrate-binding domain-containing protein n=1 Tax=Pokkaliibacter sp. CJK22405 TaxID=3384615 RepID=UPI0039847A43